ncbi:hypothetical protein A1351_00415 [Methylosinus sp. R-45379]|nr:hypothetical protein A1351_00415 [Methylosinus sp. R-45379]
MESCRNGAGTNRRYRRVVAPFPRELEAFARPSRYFAPLPRLPGAPSAATHLPPRLEIGRFGARSQRSERFSPGLSRARAPPQCDSRGVGRVNAIRRASARRAAA